MVKFSFILIKRDLTSNPFVLLIWDEESNINNGNKDR